jgi:hypothetical protein
MGGVATAADAQTERILDFLSDVELQPDSRLEVTETIRFRVLGTQIRHGASTPIAAASTALPTRATAATTPITAAAVAAAAGPTAARARSADFSSDLGGGLSTAIAADGTYQLVRQAGGQPVTDLESRFEDALFPADNELSISATDQNRIVVAVGATPDTLSGLGEGEVHCGAPCSRRAGRVLIREPASSGSSPSPSPRLMTRWPTKTHGGAIDFKAAARAGSIAS